MTASTIPNDVLCVADYQRLAKEVLPHSIYEYIYGGGGDELTLKQNHSALNAIQLWPRVLNDVTQGTTATTVLGELWRSPIMLAPVAFQTMVHQEGEIATARAASALDVGMMVSTLASHSIEGISECLSSPKWFQLYWQLDRGFNLELVRRAEQSGYTALVVTVDSAIHGIRNRAQRAHFTLPEGITAINLANRPPLPSNSFTPDQSIVFQGMMSEAPTWEDIAWLIKQTELPVVVKGILHPSDAIKAKSIGAKGVVVSNHGGRTLDCVPSAIEVLPDIRQAVGESFTLLMDGGIQRGTDVFKAVALGANAVLIGRPQIYALAVAGAAGVAHMLRILREELEVAMALAGAATIEDISPVSLYKRR
ncbi:alpha-hydroxy-acid oxidizing protein [Marinomonas rhizomae]|uniref:Isopentenyl diphosphate isomerase/L-lactate dehydrogenase-like FMN-dependent dehydrogenase n=1 Tax=Marinomonas rhizomae TaxID=491948 RepID=A0A366JCE6_9GAMM|nr:alpha-hydroxy acid oxidase [Marinomonas rhizomae]RBP84656.1 isopentenyl diphosphate isomerase/L-lactate dehydrogenase-like FMN-dependent dehydrogenase [Marinomonas rhizomae]RNF75139.1 alpha-hydroxy-acid oxidizing protein [Marinomonas rhizomae]